MTVYKCPIAEHRLSIVKDEVNCVQVSSPKERMGGFYTFSLLHPPLDISSIKECFSSPRTMHWRNCIDAGYAHLDVRIPNIRFDSFNGEWKAANPPISKHPLMYNKIFKDLTMYDWRQFSLLLSCVIEGSDHDYHTRPPVFDDTTEQRELQNCFDNGLKPSFRVGRSMIPSYGIP